MEIVSVKYLEHNNVKFFVGEHVVLNSYNKPDLSCTIDSINDNGFRPGISVVPDDGGLVILRLSEIEKIRKTEK